MGNIEHANAVRNTSVIQQLLGIGGNINELGF
jgi:hypothetical protein